MERGGPRILEGEHFVRAWRDVATDRRARIEGAVREGTSLTDVDDAALAVGLAIEKRRSATTSLLIAAAIAVVVIGFSTSDSIGRPILVLAAAPLIWAAFAHKRRGAALKAELHNRDVVYEAQAKLQPPLPPAAGEVTDPWRDVPTPPRPLDPIEDDETPTTGEKPLAGEAPERTDPGERTEGPG